MLENRAGGPTPTRLEKMQLLAVIARHMHAILDTSTWTDAALNE